MIDNFRNPETGCFEYAFQFPEVIQVFHAKRNVIKNDFATEWSAMILLDCRLSAFPFKKSYQVSF